jgi:hypothetical protein
MKYFTLIIGFLSFSCTSPEKQPSVSEGKDSAVNSDTEMVVSSPAKRDSITMIDKNEVAVDTEPSTDKDVIYKNPSHEKVYSNQRFKDVTIKQVGPHEFRIKGKGQIFEASFGWVIEDGHEELQQGYATTDAGAPEWGNFSFVVNAQKIRPNSTLHLVLYETSAKDGSRQYELPIPLF